MTGKLVFLRAILERYGTYKPIMLNETALICSIECPFKDYDPAQANHITRLYTRAHAQGLIAVVWFTFNGPGWRGGGLLDVAQKPRQGYFAYKFLAALLNDAQYIGSSANGALECYSFRKGTTTYQICWTNDGSVVPLALPPNTTALYDKVGTPRALPDKRSTISIGFEPVIIASSS